MIPNNNLSVLPWYTSIEQQNARKWWVYGRVYPLFTPAGFILPFQFIIPYQTTHQITNCWLYDANTDTVIDSSVADKIRNTGIQVKNFQSLGYAVVVYPGL